MPDVFFKHQFYAMYSAPLLLLLMNGPRPYLRVIPWIAVELVFNLYPPRPAAALLLQAAHLVSLAIIYNDK